MKIEKLSNGFKVTSYNIEDEELILEDAICSIATRYFYLLSPDAKYKMLERIVSEYEHEVLMFEQHEQLGELLYTPPKEA